MGNGISLVRTELLQLFRDRAFPGLMFLLLLLMTLAIWNTHRHITDKKYQTEVQQELVKKNDEQLTAQIDSLTRGLATYEGSYTLPTSGVRLTYNNHRLAWLPLKVFSLVAIGQGDLYSNYKKVILYFNHSYEMTSQELASPIEQLFGQLDLAFVWVYLLPLIILLISFNILSIERETGRLPLIASQPIQVSHWLWMKISTRFLTIFFPIVLFTFILLVVFGVQVIEHGAVFGQLVLLLFLYSAFWFFLSFLVNLAGYSSGKSLIYLTSIWILFVFLIPSIVNQVGKELHPVPSRLEIINHHQAMYNEMESNLDAEMEALFRLHPDWRSNDPVTKDISNSTGWNINYLAKQYRAQTKHRLVAQIYEDKVDRRNHWFGRFRLLSPAMILQEALADMAGTSSRYYRSFLRQTQAYAREYRQYVFGRLFTNHAFTPTEIKNLPKFEFDNQQVPGTFIDDFFVLLAYLVLLGLAILGLAKRKIQVR